jgi:hypothetical protein
MPLKRVFRLPPTCASRLQVSRDATTNQLCRCAQYLLIRLLLVVVIDHDSVGERQLQELHNQIVEIQKVTGKIIRLRTSSTSIGLIDTTPNATTSVSGAIVPDESQS